MDTEKMTELLKGLVGSLTDEQKEQAKACETVDELLALLGQMGVELPDELLDDVGGGLNLTFANLTHTPNIGRFRLNDLFGSSPFSVEHADLTAEGGMWEATHMDVRGGIPSLEVTHLDVRGNGPQRPTRYV